MRNGDIAAWMGIVTGALVSATLSMSLASPSALGPPSTSASTASTGAPLALAESPRDELWASGERRIIDFAVIRVQGSTHEVWAGPGADRFLWERRGALPHRNQPGERR